MTKLTTFSQYVTNICPAFFFQENVGIRVKYLQLSQEAFNPWDYDWSGCPAMVSLRCIIRALGFHMERLYPDITMIDSASISVSLTPSYTIPLFEFPFPLSLCGHRLPINPCLPLPAWICVRGLTSILAPIQHTAARTTFFLNSLISGNAENVWNNFHT